MNLSTFKTSKKSQKNHYLLFGHPVEHSWSPLMHNTALEYYGIDANYYAVDLLNGELNSLAAYLNKDSFLGANITVPYKQVIVDYLDHIDQQAQKIGAVNTIVKDHHQLVGYNTDWTGFTAPIEKFENEIAGARAIVFGTGGASRAITVGLIKLGIEEIFLVSRTPDSISSFDDFEEVSVISYHQWTSIAKEAVLVVNATPLGMYPETEKSPVRETEKEFLEGRICYDIVYNPIESRFLHQAKSVGAVTVGGLEMLLQQGSRSFELWTGRPFPKIVKERLHEKLKD